MRSDSLVRVLLALSLTVYLSACGGGEPTTGEPSVAAAADKSTRALAAPASPAASQPVAPFSANGWYWNPAEGGTGFMFEAQGTRAFVGFFMYEEGSGKPIWYVATGDLTNGDAAGDHRFSGDLRVYHGGMGLTDRVRTSPTSRSLGTVGIDFVGGRAIVALPGGRVMNAERFCAGGPCVANPAPASGTDPETGWYWNPDEGGRGYAIESYNGRRFIGIFHYNPDGSPVWHVSSSGGPDRALEQVITSGRITGLELYTGGQSLNSSHRQATGNFIARVTLVFSTACAGQLEVAGLPQISIRRFVIDGASLPAGYECNALATLADVPDIRPLPLSAFGDLQPGDLVHGLIDSSGDADAYSIFLAEGTYTFDVLGVASGAGTLPDPSLSLHDSAMAQVAENDDRDPATSESRITHTITSSGIYQLRVRSSSRHPGSGSFILKVGGAFRGAAPAGVPASAYNGVFNGKLLGPDLAYLSLAVAREGSVAGSLVFMSTRAERIDLSGTVTPAGDVNVSGFSLFSGRIQCQTNLVLRSQFSGVSAFTGSFGGCGDLGMLVGDFVIRQPSPVEAPLIAIVGEGVPMTSTIADPLAVHEWDFGDGSVGSGSSTVHRYATPGTYTIIHRAGNPLEADAALSVTVV